MILVIDNYDSFTYNLVQYLGEMGQDLKVVRNDKITLNKIHFMSIFVNQNSIISTRWKNKNQQGNEISNFFSFFSCL